MAQNEGSPNQSRGKRWQAWLLLVAVFLLVGCGLVYELLIASYSSHLQGDSIYQFSLTIGLFLSAMGVGSYWTQRFKDRLIERLLEVQMLLALFGGGTIAFLSLSDLWTRNYFFLCHAWTVFLGALIGFVLPISVRIIEETMPLHTLLARVMLFDYIGALAGSLLFPWWLLPSLGFANASLLVGGVCLLSFGLVVIAFRPSIEGLPRKLALACAIGLLLVGGWGRVESFLEMLIEQQTPGLKKVTILRSTYQEIRFVSFYGSYFLTLNRHPQFSSQDEKRYHESLVHPAMTFAKDRKRVLILGGGDGLAVRDLWRYHDVEEITMVDLDPAMTDFGTLDPVMQTLNEKAMRPPKERIFCLYEAFCPGKEPVLRYQIPRSGMTCPASPPDLLTPPLLTVCDLRVREAIQRPKIRVFNTDAWKFLERDRSQFSVILSDLPDATNISLSKLYSLEFYRMLRRRLRPGGALAIQSTSVAPGYRRAFWCIVQTVEAAGFQVKNYAAWVPSFGMHTSFLLASDRPIEPSQMRLTTPASYLHQAMLPALFWFPKDIQKVQTRINRIDTHILLRYLIKN